MCLEADSPHAEQVWTDFNFNTLKDYMSLFLISNICLLADVFETFQSNFLEEYQLDPVYYVCATACMERAPTVY